MPARLLVVDDEPALAELLKKYLERLGYEVDLCGTGEQALEKFEQNPSSYALVLADLTLPGINGDETITRMRAVSKNLRAILASGYPHHPASKQTAFLQKPFLPKMLADLIEKKLKS
jgi:DNA-binding response OmpR family regulator